MAYNESDESVIERWIESPYWQNFCGFELFWHTCPIDPSNLSHWRTRVGPEKIEALLIQSRLRHAGHKRKAAREVRKLKSYLRHVLLDISRQADPDDATMKELLFRAASLLTKTRESKDKLYSFHTPELECIGKGKGKAHKKYEFGVKVDLAITVQGNWIVGAQSFPRKPYDGHTPAALLAQVKRITKVRLVEVLVDRGYRGHDAPADVNVLIDNKAKNRTRRMRKWMGRHSAVEPIIGYAKQDHRMGRNHLRGKIGDATNAILAAAGFNFRKLIRAYGRIFLRLLSEWLLGFQFAAQHRVAQASVA